MPALRTGWNGPCQEVPRAMFEVMCRDLFRRLGLAGRQLAAAAQRFNRGAADVRPAFSKLLGGLGCCRVLSARTLWRD